MYMYGWFDKNMEINFRLFKLIFRSHLKFIFPIIFNKYRLFLSTKTSKIRSQRHIRNAFRGTIKSKFFSGETPLLVLSPLVPSSLDLVFSLDHFYRGNGPGMNNLNTNK